MEKEQDLPSLIILGETGNPKSPLVLADLSKNYGFTGTYSLIPSRTWNV